MVYLLSILHVFQVVFFLFRLKNMQFKNFYLFLFIVSSMALLFFFFTFQKLLCSTYWFSLLRADVGKNKILITDSFV